MRTVGRRKITHGHAIQTFDDNGKCVEQEFVAGDHVEWESEDMEPLDEADDRAECEYQPFDMVQPNQNIVDVDKVLALLESLENPLRSYRIRTESVARQIRALCQKETD